jgi:hypothetical protein
MLRPYNDQGSVTILSNAPSLYISQTDNSQKAEGKTSVGRNVGIKRPLCTAAHGGVQGIVDRTIFRTPEEKRNCVSQAQGSIAGRSLTTLSQIRFINTYF